MNSGVSGNPLPEPSNCSPTSQLSERGASSSVQVDETLLQQVFTEANLISAYDLFEAKVKQGKHLSLSIAGRFGVLLARCCFFGDDVLQTSTLKGRGKGSRPGLDPHKFHALMMEIHRQPAFSSLSMDDFNRTVKVKIEQSLRDYLKPSGSISKRNFLTLQQSILYQYMCLCVGVCYMWKSTHFSVLYQYMCTCAYVLVYVVKCRNPHTSVFCISTCVHVRMCWCMLLHVGNPCIFYQYMCI